MKIKKMIAMGLLGVTTMGALATMPAVKVGNHTIGTETVEAWSGNYTRSWSYREWQGRPNYSRYRFVTVNNVFNRHGRLVHSYKTYSGWIRPVG